MIYSFKINWKVHLKLILLCYLGVLVFYSVVNTILDEFFLNELIFYPTSNILFNIYIHIIILVVPISIIHELIHGMFFKLFGGRVKFGYKIIYAYTQEISEKPIEVLKFLGVLLAPLVIISLLCMLLPKWIGGMIYLINLLGSSGDIYMAIGLSKYSGCKVIDRSYGYDVIES